MEQNWKEYVEKGATMDWKQAAFAVVAGVAVLAAVYLLIPRTQAEPVEEEVVATPAPDPFRKVRVEAKAAIVYDLVTGEVLYGKNVDAQLPLASLTKLLTVYAALEALPLSAPITISDRSVAIEGESGVSVGEVFSLENAAKLSLVASSNDVTEAIIEAVEQHRSMNDKELLASAALAMQLTQTYAHNATGLDETASTSGGYGSAYDMARLAGALAEKAPSLGEATTYPSVTVRSQAGYPHTLSNTNQGIMRVPGARLSKTGFTDLAGGNLVIVYDAGIDHPVAIAVLGSSVEGRFSDVRRLMDATMAHFAGTDL